MENNVLRKGINTDAEDEDSKARTICSKLFTLEEEQSEEDSPLL